MIKRLLVILAMLCACAGAQVPVSPIVNPHVTFVNSAGAPCWGCSLYSYAAGSTTPQATYTDSTGTTQNTNPIVLDASGGANIWFGGNSYKIVLIDSTGATIWSVDNVNSPWMLRGGALGSLPYQTSASTTAFLPSPTAAGAYVPLWQPTGSAVAPTMIGGIAALNALGASGTGTVTFPNSFTAGSVNNVINSALEPGSDIGAKVNAAIAAMGTACGIVMTPNGSYTLSTEIFKPSCVTLLFNGSQIRSTITATASIAVGNVPNNGYTWGGIRDLTLLGPGSAATGDGIGIWLGGDTTGVNAPSTWQDYSEFFSGVTVLGFSAGWERGVAYQDSFYSITAASNYNGWVDSGQYFGENMSFYGAELVNNAGSGLYSANMDGTEYNFFGSSIDYNANSGINYLNGSVRLFGGHMEQSSGYLITGPASTSLANNLTISGATTLALTATTGSTEPGLIQVTGYNSNVKIAPGVILGYDHPVSHLINWTGTGSSNLLEVGAYEDAFHNPALSTIAAPVAGWNHYMIYGQYVPTSEYFQGITVGNPSNQNSIQSLGIVGTSGNLNGTIPPITPANFLNSSGSYLAWNGEVQGETDFLNPNLVSASGNDAFAFYGNIAGTWTKFGNLKNNGIFNALQGFSVAGTQGFTGTKVAGACTFTIVGGIITNVTGC